MTTLRIAAVTDIHYGFDIGHKIGSAAPRLMDDFIAAVNRDRPDLVVDLGDRISRTDIKTDRRNLRKLQNHFSDCTVPVINLMGNYDVENLSREENEDITGSPSGSYGLDVKGHHLIFWNPLYRIDKETGFNLETGDIDWLRDHLDIRRHKPALLFSHVPLDSLNGEEHTGPTKNYGWSQTAQVRGILEDVGNVRLCLHGHCHIDRRRTINGIDYLTIQSLTALWDRETRETYGAYAVLESNGKTMTVERRGRAPLRHEIGNREPRFAAA